MGTEFKANMYVRGVADPGIFDIGYERRHVGGKGWLQEAPCHVDVSDRNKR